jgi:DNA-binding NtrC family response regulator
MILKDCSPLPQESSLAPFSKQRILMIEDRNSHRWAIHSILTHMGYDVIAIGTLVDGLAALRPPPHAILLNLVLPDGQGELLLEAVSSAGVAHRVIVCTENASVVRLKALHRFEPVAILPKPVGLADLFVACHALQRDEREGVSDQAGRSELNTIIG